ncbi:MAG: efflux RND transporter periplasmic adaptor subunit [Gammaproteobacteria bacterium]|nr:efflux RND transporter periplasmic adaptor subunit [Gammaproteobacteria bacterium]
MALSFLAGCQGKGSEGEAAGGDKGKDKEESPLVPVEVASPARNQMLATYSGTASIEAFAEADVIAKVGGEVRQLLVEEGDEVKAGQVLAVLDGDRLRLELKQTEANMNKLEREYQRNLDLHDKGLVSVGAFENIKYELDALRAGYDRAKLELSYTQLRAPIDGVIAERFIKVGNTLSANDRTFHVTTLKPLIIYLHAPEKEYRKIQPGQSSMVEVDALKGRRFPADVARISPIIDPASGTFKITIEVDDPSRNLKPGMFGRVHIVHEIHDNALVIPREAIVVDGEEEAVFLIEDCKAVRRQLSTGITLDGQVEVLSGLSDGDRFVLVGQAGLKDGAKVQVVNESPELGDQACNKPDADKPEDD